MTLFHVIGLVLTVIALFGYVNARFIRLPGPIGITAVSLAVSLIVALSGFVHPGPAEWAQHALDELDFTDVVFQGMLGLLLFAGSLHIDWSDIAHERWPIIALATVGVVVSTVLVGTGLYYTLQWFGLPVSLLNCMLFGALISPTDPIAVMALLRKLRIPKRLETRIAGESLFNDGTGVVVFVTLLGIATSATAPTPGAIASLLAIEVLGGIAVGFVVGYLGFYLLRGIDSYAVEILITLSMATAGYALADLLHASAPIAVVIMGLVIGNHGRAYAMSEHTRARLFDFWEVVDDILNLVLFGFIGLNVVALLPRIELIMPALLAIPMVLIARWVSVGVPLLALPRLLRASHNEIRVMVWGGLRGGISVALALSLPSALHGRDVLVAGTYAVVLFSILVQALTLGRLMRWLERSRLARRAQRTRSDT